MAPLALALAYAGFLALALAMDRHAAEMRAMRRVPPPRRRALQSGGTVLVGLSLWASVTAWGPAFGVVGWLGALTGGALVLVLVLALVPRLAMRLALPLLLCGALAAAMSG